MRSSVHLAILALGFAGCISDHDLNPITEPEEIPDTDTDDPIVDDVDAPIARCEVTPDTVKPPFEDATWDGSDSYDPGGYEITEYDWTLWHKPAGSAATMPNGTAVRPNFVPDLAGDYVGELVVTNELGVSSAPCRATLTAIPGEALWVEMYWTHSGDDMDLHLLAPGGHLESNSDCYFANCVGGGLNWGGSGRADDPALDLDDIPGVGPENINIEDPQSGDFTVFVHDYPGSVNNTANDTTVKIYLEGVLVWEKVKRITTEDSYTPYAIVNPETGEISDL